MKKDVKEITKYLTKKYDIQKDELAEVASSVEFAIEQLDLKVKYLLRMKRRGE